MLQGLVECLGRLPAWRGAPWLRHDIPKPPAPAVAPERPEPVARREAARQKTLKRRRKQAGPEAPARTLEWIEYKWIEPSRVRESCDVAIAVLLLRNPYANGESLEWAIASTRVFGDPLDMCTAYQLRPTVEEDHRQEKCFWDMTGFRSASFPQVVNRILSVELAGTTRQRLLDSLLPQENRVALYCQGRYGLFTVYEYQELLLTLTDGPRRKVLGKTRRLRRAQRRPPEQPWRPRPCRQDASRRRHPVPGCSGTVCFTGRGGPAP